MKKISAIIIAVIFVLYLTACSTKSADLVSNNPPASSVITNTYIQSDISVTDTFSTTKPTTSVKADTSSKNPASSSSKQQTAQTPVVSSSQAQQTTPSSKPQQTQENVFFNANNFLMTPNDVTIKPRHVYWENGKLVAQCFIINGCNYPVYNLNVKSLVFANSQVKIADGGFGYMQSNDQNISISANSYVIWTFTFSGDSVTTVNADLGRLICNSNVNYQH